MSIQFIHQFILAENNYSFELADFGIDIEPYSEAILLQIYVYNSAGKLHSGALELIFARPPVPSANYKLNPAQCTTGYSQSSS